MKFLLPIFLILISNPVQGQGKSFQSTEEVAKYMVNKYQEEDHKIRAIYDWVTGNFLYDAKNTFAINAGSDLSAKILVAFARRKGVCENISAIFNDICIKSGIKSFVISGYTKQSGAVDRSGHSWCAAFINNQWVLFDPTWDLGQTSRPQYFMISPQDFIITHMPFDPLWQLLNYPVSHSQFAGLAKSGEKKYFFNFSDSLRSFIAMDSLQKLQSAASRIERNGLYNERVKVNYQVIKMNIEIAHQEKETELYNSAAEELNIVTKKLNQFIEYRNNRFMPLKSESDLSAMLDGVDNAIISALKKLDEIDRSEAKLVLATESERNRIVRLVEKIKDQKIFLTQYLSMEIATRSLLFYDKK